uniref:inositol-polyphosphate 5-phosphatase n=1 Tax=Ceratitis capitata TaxID=7213 RepID=W8CCA9_CERCA
MLESKTHSESHKKDVNTNSILLLVTANVGSLFEDPLTLMQIWVDEFLTTVRQICPHFIALHLQEVGGKIYDKSSNQVKRFVELLCEGLEKQQFFIFRIYMDENINASEQFTALGNLYFCHRTLVRSCIWNFEINSWEPTQRAEKYFGNIETIPTKEKSKFPLEFFPDSKWSRKGFMRTRWNIDGTIVDFVNIHLFHDASNLTAVENSPSVYSQMRRKALLHTLQRFYNDKNNEPVPYFLFGDFNFRCDSASVIKELTRNLTKHRASTTNANSSKVFYRNEIGENVLIIGKKEFHYVENQGMIKDNWLSKYDRDPEPFNDILCEFEFDFKPSYPFEEDPELPNQYMKTRCPAWCDRVLMSSQIPEISSPKKAYEQYNTMGKSICMGDHKPVYLYVEMKSNKDIVKPSGNFLELLQDVSRRISSDDCNITKKRHHTKPITQFIKFNKSTLPENPCTIFVPRRKCQTLRCCINFEGRNDFIILKESIL